MSNSLFNPIVLFEILSSDPGLVAEHNAVLQERAATMTARFAEGKLGIPTSKMSKIERAMGGRELIGLIEV